jgi:hypothetical protein
MSTAAVPAAAVPAAAVPAIALVQSILTLRCWDRLPFLIIFLIFQGIDPNILYELLPHFQLSHRQIRNITLAMMQLRLFTLSFLPDIMGVKHLSYQRKCQIIRQNQNPHDWVFRQFYIFRNRIFFNLLKKGGFDGTLKFTGYAVREFFSNFVVFRRSPIFPIGQLFLSQTDDLICLKTACEMILLFEHMRSSYPEIFSFLAHNEIALQNIILVWKTQMCIKEKGYCKSKKHCHEIYSGNITDHPINDLFIFCMLAITHPGFIDKKIWFFIKNFGDRSKLVEDSYDPKYLEFLSKNCKISELKFLQPCVDIRRVIGTFSRMRNSDGAHGVKYELQPATAASGIYQIHDPQFECLTKEVNMEQMFGVFTIFLKILLKNFARTFEEWGRSALPPLPPHAL